MDLKYFNKYISRIIQEEKILNAFKKAKYEVASVNMELSKPDLKSSTQRENSNFDYRKKRITKDLQDLTDQRESEGREGIKNLRF